MTVDETWDQAATFEVDGRNATNGQRLVADGKYPAAADQHVSRPEVLGREDSGVGEKLQQWTVRAKKRGDSLH